MAFNLTIEGTIVDQHSDPVEGMTVVLRNSGGSNRNQTTTDASGFYSVSISSDNNGPDNYHADPASLSPHYSDPGSGPGYEWAADVNDTTTQNFQSTFSNSSPTVTQISDKTYEQDSGSFTADATMSDSDAGDVLTPVKTQGPAWATIAKINNSTLRWTFNTAGVAPGNYTCGYRVDDDWGGSSATRTFNVEITTANQAPVVTNPGTKQYQNNSGIQTFQLEASDPDLDTLTYSKESSEHAWGTINSVTGIVSVNTDTAPRTTTAGFIWRATDPGGLFDEAEHSIEILNNPPVLTNPGTRIYERASGEQTFDLAASDADDDPLSYSKVSGPAWVTVGVPGGGPDNQVTVDTDTAPEGTHSVTWEVSDGQGGTDQETHDIVIGAADEAGWFQVAG